MKSKSTYPEWVTKFKKPGTEIKKINGRFYAYSVKSKYDPTIKRARKISLGILGSITENGFIPSEKKELKKKAAKTYSDKEAFSLEYGYSVWLTQLLEEEGILERLKTFFPDLWQFIVSMIYCRTAYQSPLKNIPFYLSHSDLRSRIDWQENLNDQKTSDYLFDLGSRLSSIHEFMEPQNKKRQCVLVDATDIVTHSRKLDVAHKGYNSRMDFNPQFVLLYLYDASTLQPLYYRILPGNIREITALRNTIAASGIEQCVFIADKGFFSEQNVSEMEQAGLKYIIPLKRGSKSVSYNLLEDIDQSDDYFSYANRHIFYTKPVSLNNRTVCLYVDGMLKEMEKNDYLSRIQTLPEFYSKEGFKEKAKRMGTLAIIHNTTFNPIEVYTEYKQRGDIEQFFDQLKNSLNASASYMQREESLNGWMFINHLSMMVIYKIYDILKSTPLNKKQKLNHKYSIMDVITHLQTIKKIKFNKDEFIITEIDKATRILLEKMKISIT